MDGSETPYTDHFDALLAVVTYLASTPYQSRRVPHLARDLGFDTAQVRSVVEIFRGLIRQSRTTDDDGEHYYTLHLRYARRPLPTKQAGQDAKNEPLSSQEISGLLQLISSMVSHEKETSRLLLAQKDQLDRLSIELTQRNRGLVATTLTTLVVALIAAAAGIVGATMKPHPVPSTAAPAVFSRPA